MPPSGLRWSRGAPARPRHRWGFWPRWGGAEGLRPGRRPLGGACPPRPIHPTPGCRGDSGSGAIGRLYGAPGSGMVKASWAVVESLWDLVARRGPAWGARALPWPWARVPAAVSLGSRGSAQVTWEIWKFQSGKAKPKSFQRSLPRATPQSAQLNAEART